MTHTILLAFAFLYILVNVNSLCDVCQRNYAACIDEKRFKICTAGKPENKINTCPAGYICTSKTSICLPQSETNQVTPSCGMTCGKCNSPGKLFSCLSNTTYAFCFGKDVPNLSAKGVCPDGYVCNLKDREVCKKASVDLPSCNAELEKDEPIRSTPAGTTESSITTLKPKVTDSYGKTTVATKDEPTTGGRFTTVEVTSPKTSTIEIPTKTSSQPTLTTTIEVTSPKTTTVMAEISTNIPIQTTLSTTTEMFEYESSFCKEKQAEGQYRLENDPTCQRFMLCYFLAGQYLELQYTCPGSYFFNDQTKNCQIEKPVDC